MTPGDKISLGIGFLTFVAILLAYYQLRQSEKAAKLDRSYQITDRYFTYYANLDTRPGVLPVERLMFPGGPEWDEWIKNEMQERGFFRRLAKYWVQNSIDRETINDHLGIIIIFRYYAIADDMKSRIGTETPLMAEWAIMVSELETMRNGFNFLTWLYRDIHNQTGR